MAVKPFSNIRGKLVAIAAIWFCLSVLGQYEPLILSGSRLLDQSSAHLQTAEGSLFGLPQSIAQRIDVLEGDLDGNGSIEMVVLGHYGAGNVQRLWVYDPATGTVKASLEPADLAAQLAGPGQLSMAFSAATPPKLFIGSKGDNKLNIAAFRFLGDHFELIPNIALNLPGCVASTGLHGSQTMWIGPLFTNNEWRMVRLNSSGQLGTSIGLEWHHDAPPFHLQWLQLAQQFWLQPKYHYTIDVLAADGTFVETITPSNVPAYTQYRFLVLPSSLFILGTDLANGNNQLLSYDRNGISINEQGRIGIKNLYAPNLHRRGSLTILGSGSDLGVRITAPSQGFITNDLVLAVSGTYSGDVERLTLNGDTLEFGGGSWNHEIQPDEGPLSLRVQAQGNTATVQDRIDGLVDRTPAVITIAQPINGALITQMPLTLSGTLNDNYGLPHRN